MTDNTAYSIRQFTMAEVEAYKRIRLEALATEPGMFGNSYAMEAALPQEDWINRISLHRQCAFWPLFTTTS